MISASSAERKAQYLDMARMMSAAADRAADDKVKAQYLDLASKWIRLADEVSRHAGDPLQSLVGAEDLLARERHDGTAPEGETPLQDRS